MTHVPPGSAAEDVPVGSASEEALKLLLALGSSTRTPAAATAAPTDASTHDQHGCSTSWCPVCQVADFVRDNPEVIAGVVSSAGSMLGSLRHLLDAALVPKDRS